MMKIAWLLCATLNFGIGIFNLLNHNYLSIINISVGVISFGMFIIYATESLSKRQSLEKVE